MYDEYRRYEEYMAGVYPGRVHPYCHHAAHGDTTSGGVADRQKEPSRHGRALLSASGYAFGYIYILV